MKRLPKSEGLGALASANVPRKGELILIPFFKRRRTRFIAISGVLLIVLLGSAWWWRAPILRGVARLWIISDTPAQADAIVILGGGLETRPIAAVQLYRAGWAKQILVLQPERTRITELDLVLDFGAATRKLLLQENIPESAVVFIEPEVTSTIEEAEALAVWAKGNQAKLLLVPTDIFHTRRARWTLRRKLKDSGTDVRMIPVPLRQYSAENWWQTEHGLLDFQNEIAKSALYWWRY